MSLNIRTILTFQQKKGSLTSTITDTNFQKCLSFNLKCLHLVIVEFQNLFFENWASLKSIIYKIEERRRLQKIGREIRFCRNNGARVILSRYFLVT